MDAIVRSLGEFLDADIAKAELVVDPWLPEGGLAMLAGPRGGGKTMVALALAIAIVGGGTVLGWTVSVPHGVLYVDGEMALSDMQDRVTHLLKGAEGVDVELARKNLHFICDADQEGGLKNLVQYPATRKMIERTMGEKGADVLILDNLSALCNSDAENDVESWTTMQEWLIGLRRRGNTCLFLHHTGKRDRETGMVHQRGTSKREDVLNTSILMVPDMKDDSEFSVVFTKHRGFNPDRGLRGKMEFFPGEFYRIRSLDPKTMLGKKGMEKLTARLG